MSTTDVVVADLEYGPVNAAVLCLLPWLRAEVGSGLRVLSVFDGGIRREFSDIAAVTAVNEYRPRRASTALRELGFARAAEAARSIGLRRRLGSGSVYLADVAAARLLEWVGADVAVLGHWRVGDGTRWPQLTEADRRAAGRVDRWLVEHGATLPAVLRGGQVRIAARQDVPLELCWPEVRASTRAERRRVLADDFGIPEAALLVVSGGHLDFWHETDVFAQLCWTAHASRPELGIRYAWFGGDSSTRMLWPLRHDLTHAGLDAVVHVVEGPDVPLLEAAAAADVFVRTNRHPPDPWLDEAMAAAGVPRVGFVHGEVSGEADLDRQAGAPVLVPWLDVGALAATTVGLLAEPDARRDRGQPDLDAPSTWDRRVAARVIGELLGRPRP